ncbi:DAR GTPase 3, chloroplastic [Planktothrix tepida]|uniref:Ribosome biogenesis GTPase A n=2 Tax=Planktothrix TaxID=54304 RepID=A0A1J1LF18_9CYAN|nr:MULTISPECIES: ribosome biogenesis GTPase YlqF [Planktothrix]CAD5918371.1 DAR GTPase 3, chloroplastic [Planktothrix tepida]CAD5984738.1 DAR GTPase 3, chloroplastic [Planktothrix pseudagardhii]CUR30782.1 Ribosome biogenesis GTPase A [Planktothrix tepida PCC 9214]
MSIQWYPGHIAKAERTLTEQLKRVDVVLEVRDARIPLATHHPQVPQWVGSKTKVLVINRMDMIPSHIQKQWEEWFQQRGETAYFTNAQLGNGVEAVAKAAQLAGVQMNEKRASRGMLPRPVRAVVIGFPNVGKSALINRLLKRRVVDSARRAGVTRQLRWVRISETLELLDAPGVIPTQIKKQEDALKLAICEDIGEAAYENQQVAVALIEFLQDLNLQHLLATRYQLEFNALSGDIYLQELAEHRHKGDIERTARQLLNDFRKGLLGNIALELPPH